MPDSLEAAVVFAILIVPGYQIVRGYAVARSDAPPTAQLYVLAQAVVASLAWLLITWPAVRHLLEWVGDDTVSAHLVASYAIVALLLGTPYFVGRQTGRFVGAITRKHNRRGPDWAWRCAIALGVGDKGTAWDELWLRATDLQAPLVTVALDDGTALHGQFGEHSRVMASPDEPAIYFERAYETHPDTGELLAVYPGGAHVIGTRIVALKLADEP